MGQFFQQVCCVWRGVCVRFACVVQVRWRCDHYTRDGSHSEGVSKFGHRPTPRRVWQAVFSVEAGNWIPTLSDSDTRGLMIERVAVAQRAMLAPTIRASGGPSDRSVLRFMQLRDVVSSFAVFFRFFWFGLHLHSSCCVFMLYRFFRVVPGALRCEHSDTHIVGTWCCVLHSFDVHFWFVQHRWAGPRGRVVCQYLWFFDAMCRFVRVVQDWGRCHHHTRGRGHSSGATNCGHKPTQRRTWPTMVSVEAGNWIPADSDSDKRALMVERVAVAQRALLAPTIRSSGGPSDRCVLRFMQLRDVVSSFGVVFRYFFGFGVHLHSSCCVLRCIVSFASCSERCDVNIRTHISWALDVVFIIRSMWIFGLFNIGGLEPGVSYLLIFVVSRRDVSFCSCCSELEKMSSTFT